MKKIEWLRRGFTWMLALGFIVGTIGFSACQNYSEEESSKNESTLESAEEGSSFIPQEITKEQVNTFDEEYVNLYGRTYVQDGKLNLDHVTSAIELGISAPSLMATIEVDTKLYLNVYIDGAETYERIELTAGSKEYKLASDLTDGYHKMRVVKSSELYDGQIRIISFNSVQFATVAEKSGLKIEFIGDSITAGYGVLGKAGDSRTVENSDGCGSYAYYAALGLEADYSTIAVSGICVKAPMWAEVQMNDVYKQVSPLNGEEYAFDFDPDVVVLNLGTNDASYLNERDTSYAKQFPTDYYEFLQYIRQKNPNAYIVCLYGMMGKDPRISDGIAAAVSQMNDEKIVYRSNYAADNAGVVGHPTAASHKNWGKSLATYIRGLDIE